jgi:phosphate starvation-inducible PhoH-like protein
MQGQEYEMIIPHGKITRGCRKHPELDNIVSFKTFVEQRKTVSLQPKSEKQKEYINMLFDPEKKIVFSTGPAGTGKTILAVQAAIKALKNGHVNKIIVTRPAVEVENEKIGFLPGTLNEKMEPWTRPIFDVLKEYYSLKEITRMLSDEVIEISPLAFMRGRTFKDSYLIADEMQNATPAQLKMLLTRGGDNCKIIITGDIQQTDRRADNSGITDFFIKLSKFGTSKYISVVEFTGNDIQRHPAIEEILKIYEDF